MGFQRWGFFETTQMPSQLSYYFTRILNPALKEVLFYCILENKTTCARQRYHRVVRGATSVPKHRSHDIQFPNLFHLHNKYHCHTSNPMHSLQYILFSRRAGSPYWKTEVLASTQDKGWWITFQSISTTKRDVDEKHDQFRTMITARLSIHWSISGKWIVKKTELIQVN